MGNVDWERQRVDTREVEPTRGVRGNLRPDNGTVVVGDAVPTTVVVVTVVVRVAEQIRGGTDPVEVGTSCRSIVTFEITVKDRVDSAGRGDSYVLGPPDGRDTVVVGGGRRGAFLKEDETARVVRTSVTDPDEAVITTEEGRRGGVAVVPEVGRIIEVGVVEPVVGRREETRKRNNTQVPSIGLKTNAGILEIEDQTMVEQVRKPAVVKKVGNSSFLPFSLPKLL